MAIADVSVDTVVDYAMPLIKAEKLLRQIHDKCLDKQYREAGDLVALAITELRVLTASLAIMSEKER